MEKNEKITPMLQQYLDVKKQYDKYVLFYRLGDFYEMFFDDAVNISKELELTLTSRAGVPMCGVPHHSSETYIKRLIDKGYKVAICEQTEDPALSKGLVTRDVVRIVTPGTVVEEGMLQDDKNNYIACIYAQESTCGLAFADVSTGEFHIVEKLSGNIQQEVISELSRFTPVEILYNDGFLSYSEVHRFIKIRLPVCVGDVLKNEWYCPDEKTEREFFSQFQSENPLPSSISVGKNALLGLFAYINDSYKNKTPRAVNFIVHENNDYMELNLTTRRNLELTETMRSKERKGSLVWVLDRTKTSMGKRKLKQFINQPLLDQIKILERLDAVEKLSSDVAALDSLGENLSGIYDLERLISRIVYKVAAPRDVKALGNACAKIPQLKISVEAFDCALFRRLNDLISSLDDVAAIVANAIKDDLPLSTKDGGYIKDGFNAELDRLRDIASGGENILEEIERKEREATGIKNLRVGNNRVFGYYIEVSNGNIGLVPDRYIRKQTLSTGERYITQELKDIEHDILGAKDRILKLEAQIFSEVRQYLSGKIDEIQQTADAIAQVDVLFSYAVSAMENNFVRPDITLESVIEIRGGRHPVIEKMRSDVPFTPNDTYLDLRKNRLIIITGPNMSGKSTFMRQVALITLMAQIGSFVPAEYARIGVVDKIFTRVGASDDLAAGQSTFMVEMNEVAEILSGATSKSLVILDEIGRGTSTFDGISIAKAVAEYINSKAIGCKTLFATHYHELIALEKDNEGIRNFSVAVSKNGDEIKFLHKIVEGGTDDSYGIEVAKLAGLPNKVINAAKKALSTMEYSSKIDLEARLRDEDEKNAQVEFSSINQQEAISRIKNLDLDGISPRDAYAVLEELKKILD